MMLDLAWIRWQLVAAIGLVACTSDDVQPESGSAEGSGSGSAEGSGSGSAEGSGSGSGSAEGTTVASDSSPSDTGNTTAPPTWPVPPWCGVPAPTDATPPRPCDGPIEVMQTGTMVASGWISCQQSGGQHRESVVECVIPEGSVGSCDPESAETPACTSDEECDAAPNGFCNSMLAEEFGPTTTCGCEYACTSDADCSEGETCLCAGSASRCVTAHCGTDADCEDGYHCWLNGNVIACDTPFDTCATSQDCTGVDCPYCEYQADLCASQCVNAESCTAGRPFLVHGRPRVASLREGALATVRVDDLGDDTRRELARYWADCGLAEHASIAAFARFALQLMSLGAPADLLADTTRAMGDEVEHARLCFALARRYGGVEVEAGPLATEDALAEPNDLVSIASLVAKEACVGETLAAIEAGEALAHASDQQVRAALDRIAADELRHAALGWRFLAWALRTTDDAGRTRIRSALASAIAAYDPAALDGPTDARLQTHGLLAGDTRRDLAQRTLLAVIAPLAETLALTDRDGLSATPCHVA